MATMLRIDAVSGSTVNSPLTLHGSFASNDAKQISQLVVSGAIALPVMDGGTPLNGLGMGANDVAIYSRGGKLRFIDGAGAESTPGDTANAVTSTDALDATAINQLYVASGAGKEVSAKSSTLVEANTTVELILQPTLGDGSNDVPVRIAGNNQLGEWAMLRLEAASDANNGDKIQFGEAVSKFSSAPGGTAKGVTTVDFGVNLASDTATANSNVGLVRHQVAMYQLDFVSTNVKGTHYLTGAYYDNNDYAGMEFRLSLCPKGATGGDFGRAVINGLGAMEMDGTGVGSTSFNLADTRTDAAEANFFDSITLNVENPAAQASGGPSGATGNAFCLVLTGTTNAVQTWSTANKAKYGNVIAVVETIGIFGNKAD